MAAIAQNGAEIVIDNAALPTVSAKQATRVCVSLLNSCWPGPHEPHMLTMFWTHSPASTPP